MDVDSIFRCWLAQLVSDHAGQFQQLLKKRPENRFITEWIFANTRILDDGFERKLSQRVHWILGGFAGWDDPRLKCANPECGLTFKDPRYFVSATFGYRRHCCKACSNRHADTRLKSTATRFRKHGGKYFGDDAIEKRRRTCLERYGADSNMRSPEGLARYRSAIIDRYGVENQFQRAEIRKKIADVKKERYGDPLYNNSNKAAETIKAKGCSFSVSRARKAKSTWLKKYGIDHPMKLESVKMKAHYGWKHGRRYRLGGDTMMSVPELAFALYCRDKGLCYIYEDPKSAMKYNDALGESHTYFPDFHIVGFRGRPVDFLVELKGDNHFKNRDPDSGVMISFKGPEYDHVEQAKYDLIVSEGVVLVTTRRYMRYVTYAKRKYGSKFHLAYAVDGK